MSPVIGGLKTICVLIGEAEEFYKRSLKFDADFKSPSNIKILSNLYILVGRSFFKIPKYLPTVF